MPRKIESTDICEYKDCNEYATTLVADRVTCEILKCCDHHADIVINTRSPEYTHYCSNCGCGAGIN